VLLQFVLFVLLQYVMLVILQYVMLFWLIAYLQFYVPLKNISLTWRRHHCRWRAAKFRPMLGAQGIRAGRELYRVTPAVTRVLCFSGPIRRTAPFSHLLRHTRGCGGSTLTRILTSCSCYYNMLYVSVIIVITIRWLIVYYITSRSRISHSYGDDTAKCRLMPGA
jgi:hypothetical protein